VIRLGAGEERPASFASLQRRPGSQERGGQALRRQCPMAFVANDPVGVRRRRPAAPRPLQLRVGTLEELQVR